MMVHVLLCIDFEQEMCGKHPMWFASPDGGSDPVISEPTDRPIRTQCIHNSIWSGLMNGKGIAGWYYRLPNQYVPLHEECPESWQEVLRYWMWFLKVSLVSKIRPRNFASLTTCIGVFPKRMLGSGRKKQRTVDGNEYRPSWRWRTWSHSQTPTSEHWLHPAA